MKKLFFFLLIGLLSVQTNAIAQSQAVQEEEYSPYYLKGQFAGSIGLISVGVGKQSFNRRLESDISFGYLPKKFGGDRLYTAAFKSTFFPIKPIEVKAVNWQPLSMGMQISYTFGSDYFASERFLARYPNRYYRFSTAFRYYLFAGGQVNFARVEKLRKFRGYYEVGTMGEYLISYIQNPSYLSPGKIFNLSLGVKMRL
ncbi:hypothetical protein [Rufibacter roseus]|uniref:Outer membrane protein beta-barrel domain-containing protein n=1 Tax=Rufibacter roseus TaxID=1567108 RepID=A0ABW2DJX9_9BACT|nr:hypothetical protein [Rufibacter roseus]